MIFINIVLNLFLKNIIESNKYQQSIFFAFFRKKLVNIDSQIIESLDASCF